MKNLFTFFIVFFIGLTAWTQNGQVKGRVMDAETGESIPFAKIVLRNDDQVVYVAISDFDGLFEISNVKPGTYELHIKLIVYNIIS